MTEGEVSTVEEPEEEEETELEYVLARFTVMGERPKDGRPGFGRLSDADMEEVEQTYVLKYVPAREIFRAGIAGGHTHEYSLIRTAALYQHAGRKISRTWDNLCGDNRQSALAVNSLRRNNRDEATTQAVQHMREGVKKAHAHADPEALRIQRKAFSSYGSVPAYARTPERVRDRAKDQYWDDWEYAHKDFVRYHWFRMMLRSTSQAEQRRYQRLHSNSGRARKAFARMPGGISGRTVANASDRLDWTPEPPSRRLTWLALSRGYGDLATAIQRASDYELRKAKRIAREESVGEPERFYTHSEHGALTLLGWIVDVQNAADEDLHCTGRTSIVNWVENSLRFHRNQRQRDRQERRMEILEDNPWQRGPLVQNDLPDGAQQLATARALSDEGARMGHCVGSYTHRVVNSHSSLVFHYEDPEGEAEDGGATVELRQRRNGKWRVMQSRGYRNRTTTSSGKAARAFEDWLAEIDELQLDGGQMEVPAATTENTLPLREQVLEDDFSPQFD